MINSCSLFILTVFALGCDSFLLKQFKSSFRNSAQTLHVSVTPSVEVIGRDIEVTPALKERIELKVGGVIAKLGHDVNSCQVRLRVHRNPEDEMHSQVTKPDSQISEATLLMKGGSTIKSTERTDNMYASIDLMAHRLAQKLKKHNEKAHMRVPSALKDAVTGIDNNGKQSSFNEEELLLELDKKYKDQALALDPFSVDMSVVKPKTFPMPPISVEEAVLCLYYIDHPFYVFRNKDSNEINVVYKRNSGGVGHIMPESKS